ncbi:MAG: alpha-amylase family glycosyl hydrolase [Paludibacteraceae bacterium]
MKNVYLFLFASLLTFNLNANPKAQTQGQPWFRHIEPTYWWSGMHNPNLQIMLHGENISICDVSINYSGISIIKKQLTDNPNYIFLYINIDKETKSGFFNIELKNGKKRQIVKYELKERKTGSANRESFSEKDNLYLIMPDRFANGNPLNDNIKGYIQGTNRGDLSSRQGGDIEGIIQHIPYLAELGITALWTTPLLDDNDTQYSYHHYAVTDYYKIDPRFGTNEDYQRLSQTATQYGIKTIIDIVPNHCGGSHWWMRDIPAKDWFNSRDGYTPSNYRMTTWTDPHASEADSYKLTHGWFAPNMPDLNLSNPLLFDYLSQAYIFWIEKAEIAGIRVDTYPYNNIWVAAKFIQSIRNEYSKMNVVGECWTKMPAEIAYYQSGSNNKDGFDSRLQSVMDFALKDKLCEVFNEKESWETGTIKLYSHFAQDFSYHNTNMIMNFVDNHDIDRYSISTQKDVRKYKMGLAMLIAVRGYPQIYYGTEIMLDGISGDYQGHRFNFPGGWKEDSHNAFTVEGRTKVENEVFDYVKSLLNYRKKNPVLQSGTMIQFIPENGIYVFFRKNEEKTVMIVCNNNENRVNVDTKRYKECLKNYETGVDIVTKIPYDIKFPFEIEGKTVKILELGYWL